MFHFRHLFGRGSLRRALADQALAHVPDQAPDGIRAVLPQARVARPAKARLDVLHLAQPPVRAARCGPQRVRFG